MKTTKIFVGVDVSKATLDVFRPDKNEVCQIENSDEAISDLCSELEKMKRQIMVLKQSWDEDAKQSIRDVLEVLKKAVKKH